MVGPYQPYCSYPPAPMPPGVYPPNTPGTLQVVISVQGGDGDSWVTASPGDTAGPTPGSKTIWYGPGTFVTFSARVGSPDGFPSPFTAFDHFEGPGVSSGASVIQQKIVANGYVRGVFAFLGRT
jgi:hypothetical protein